MTSTLKRTMTDLLEDELYGNDHQYELQQQQSQQSQQSQQPTQQQSNDFLQYLSLPNLSQDSLQKLSEPDDLNTTNNAPNTVDSNSQINNIDIQSNNLNGIYNAYGNPNTFTNPNLPDYLYSDNHLNILHNTTNVDNNNNDMINPQITEHNHYQNRNQNQMDYLNPSGSSNNINNNNNSNNNLDDDIMMVPQDNYYVYDQQDPQFIQELMQVELSNKNFQQSNELNIFKANDVFYEFSDDEDDDDDIDLQNKLDDDDMEMNLDEEEDESDFINNTDYNDININSNILNSPIQNININDEANNYLLANDDSDNINSIYSLTVPNKINQSSSFFDNQPVSSPLPSYNSNNNIPLYGSDEDDEIPEDKDKIKEEQEEEDEEEDDDIGEGLDEEEEETFDADEYAIDNELDTDLYNPAFQERKQSVSADSKPLIKKERSSSLHPTTRPKRLRRSSAILSHNHNHQPTPLLRKPRSNNNSNNDSTNSTLSKANYTVKINDDKSEDHICIIPNPKTGKPCLKKFSRPYDLIRHQNTIHASKRSFYRCMFCEDDLRRKHDLDSINDIVISCKYRNSQFSNDNSQSHITSSHNVKKIKSGVLNNSGYLSNKTFSRCDALTRHLRFRHGLNNNQVVDAMDFAKKHVEYYDN